MTYPSARHSDNVLYLPMRWVSFELPLEGPGSSVWLPPLSPSRSRSPRSGTASSSSLSTGVTRLPSGPSPRRFGTSFSPASASSADGSPCLSNGRSVPQLPKVVIGEHKSAGEMKADSAEVQAEDYLSGGDIKPDEFPATSSPATFSTSA